MEVSNSSPVRQPNLKNAAGLFAQYYEQGAFYLLVLWCLLPVFMSLNYIISGALGKYPSAEALIQEGLVPGSVNYNLALSTYQTMFFLLGAVTFCFVLLCVVFCRRRVFSLKAVLQMPWFYLFALLLLWAGILASRSEYPDLAFRGSHYMRDGFLSYCIYGSVFLCASVIRDENKRRSILRTFIAVICYMGLIVLVQETANNDFINYCFSSRRAAVFNQFNHFGYMLCMAIIASVGLFLYDRNLKKGVRFLYLAAAAFLSYVLVINDTFGAMLAVIVSLPVVLIVYGCSGRKLDLRIVAIVLVLILLVGVCFFALSSSKAGLLQNFKQLKTDLVKIISHAEDSDKAGSTRFGLWRETLARIRQRPIAGYGPEGLTGKYALDDDLLTHNTYLQITAYLGLVGLFLYLAALLSIARNRLRRLRRLDPMVLAASGAAFAYLVSAFVGCPIFNTEPYFWLFLGFAAIPCAGEQSLFSYEAGSDTAAGRPRSPRAYFRRLKADFLEAADAASSVPTAFMRTLRTFPQHCERFAFILLLLWCLLPLAAAAVFLISGALGRYPTAEELAAQGMRVGSVNYAAALNAYQTLFFVLGAVTLLYALLCVVYCRQQIFRLQALRQKPWFYLLAGLLLWSVVSSLVSDFYHHAFVGGSYVRDGLASYFIYASVFLCASLIRREDYRRRLLHTFTAVICSLALLMVIQKITDNDFLNYCFPSYGATVFNQFNHFGYMLCMASVCLAGLFLYGRSEKKHLRYLYLAAFFFLLYALILNDTFGALLAVLLSLPPLLILYVRSGRKLHPGSAALGLLLVLLAGGSFFVLSSGKATLLENFSQLKFDLIRVITQTEDAGAAGTGRFMLWQDTVRRISERPVFGFGPEGFFGKNAIHAPSRPHNEYLQIAGYLGIPALVLYLAAILTLARRQWKHSRELEPMVLVASGVAVAYLISALVGNPVYNTAPYFWLFLGISTAGGEADAPLLQPEKSSSGNAYLTSLYMRLSVLVCALLCLGAWLSFNNEREHELSDLQAMQTADTLVKNLPDPSILSDGETHYYWFDKKWELLYPSFTAMPAPYGMGSSNSAGGLLDFYIANGFIYNYDDSADYTDKIIAVAVTAEPDGSLNTAVVWLAPEA